MSVTEEIVTRRFPLHTQHAEKGAKFGAFGAWEVPLYYTSIIDEHHVVREECGIFDISHMGEFFFEGEEVVSFLDSLLPRSISSMKMGQASYMPLLNEEGGIVDDIIVYRLDETIFLIIVNAANIEKDEAWIRKYLPKDVKFENQSESFGLLALQGPKSVNVLKKAIGGKFHELPYYYCAPFEKGMIARTGYTGEDGFEIMVPKEDLLRIWKLLFDTGELTPVGFGARDTLRLEAGMLLYGHDMNDSINPIEAKISWAIDWSKQSFVGRVPLQKLKASGAKKSLIGFELMDRGIAREHYEIQKGGKKIGEVTSGTMSPTLKKTIGLAYVSAEEAVLDNEIEVVIRSRLTKAKVVKLPFYKRNR